MIERESGEKEEKSSDTWDQKSGIPAEFESFFAKKSIGSHELGEKKLSDIKSILDQIKEWKVQQLYLHKAADSFFQTVQNIRFPCLRILELRKNNIRSVEGMSLCALPCLQKLLMGSNEVVWIKEMRKIHCPSLDNIDIDENYVNDGERLTELRMPKNMHEFDIEWQGTHAMCNDCRWFFKTEAESINHFRIVLHRHSDQEQVEDSRQVRQKVEGKVYGCKCLFQLIGVDCSYTILSDKLRKSRMRNDEWLDRPILGLSSAKGWRNLGAESVLKELDQWNVQQLRLLLGEGCSHVLGCLYPVGFPQLRMLQLRYADVTSIEGVSRMHLPSLEVLFLTTNQIAKVGTVRKAHWPGILSICLNDNPVVDHEAFTQLQGPTLQVLAVGTCQCDWAFKLPFPSLDRLSKQSQ